GDATPHRLSQLLEIAGRMLAQELREELLVRADIPLRIVVLVERAPTRHGSQRGGDVGRGEHQGMTRRRSSVMGKSGSISGSATVNVPGMCPIRSKRAMRRLSAAAAFTGRSVAARPPGCTTWYVHPKIARRFHLS